MRHSDLDRTRGSHGAVVVETRRFRPIVFDKRLFKWSKTKRCYHSSALTLLGVV